MTKQSLAIRIVLAKISPLKYMVAFFSLIVGVTIPLLVHDDPKYVWLALGLIITSSLVLFSFQKVRKEFIRFSSMLAFVVWLFVSIFAFADGYIEAALWLTVPNTFYFAWFYIFASIKLDHL